MRGFIFKGKCIRDSVPPSVLSQHPSPVCSPAEIPLKINDPTFAPPVAAMECSHEWMSTHLVGNFPLNSSVQVSNCSPSEPIWGTQWTEDVTENWKIMFLFEFDLTLVAQVKNNSRGWEILTVLNWPWVFFFLLLNLTAFLRGILCSFYSTSDSLTLRSSRQFTFKISAGFNLCTRISTS